MKTAIISDTHGLLRPEALTCLQGCDLIIHAGDIGCPEILTQLTSIAPTHAVRGNNDLNLPWAANLPHYLTFEINSWQTLLTHDIADVPADLDSKIKLVITGHSHKPCIQGTVIVFTSIPAAPVAVVSNCRSHWHFSTYRLIRSPLSWCTCWIPLRDGAARSAENVSRQNAAGNPCHV
jgi:putative phosphoesterase